MQEIQISKELLDKLNELKDRFDQLTFNFGRLYVDKTILTKRAEELDALNDQLDNQYNLIVSEQDELFKNIENQYGEGTLDINTGILKLNKTSEDKPSD